MQKTFTLLLFLCIVLAGHTQVTVKLHSVTDYGAYSSIAYKAAYELEVVLNSPQFKQRVINGRFTKTNGQSNKKIYETIMAAHEVQGNDPANADGVVDLRVRTIKITSSESDWAKKCEIGSWAGTIGIDGRGDGITAICPQRLELWHKQDNVSELAGHYAHEYMHILGFSHAGLGKKSKTLVYQIGNIVAVLVKENQKKKSRQNGSVTSNFKVNDINPENFVAYKIEHNTSKADSVLKLNLKDIENSIRQLNLNIEEQNNQIRLNNNLSAEDKANMDLLNSQIQEANARKTAAGPGGLMGLDVTNITEALTKLVMERAKQELNIAFFNKFKVFLGKNPEASVLFPNTLQQFEKIYSFQFTEFLPALRDRFFEDLNSMPDHIGDVLVLPRYQKLLKDFPEIKIGIRSIATVAKIKTQQYHPAEIINELAQLPEYTEINASRMVKNYGAAWKTVNILSQSLLKKEGTLADGYMKKEELKNILSNEDSLRRYMDSLYVRLKAADIIFYLSNGEERRIDSFKFFENANESVFIAQNFVQTISNAVTRFEEAKESCEKIPVKERDKKKQCFIEYLDASFTCIDAFLNFNSLLDEKLLAQPYVDIIRQVSAIHKDAVGQKYASLAANSIGLLSTIFDLASNEALASDIEKKAEYLKADEKTHTKKALKDIKSRKTELQVLRKENEKNGGAGKAPSLSQLKEDTLQLIKESIEEYKQVGVNALSRYETEVNVSERERKKAAIKKGLNVVRKVLKYANLAACVVTAKTSTEVKEAIEAVALPPGSSSIKKNSNFNISLQAHVGAAWNAYSYNKSPANNAWLNKFNVTLPIGVSFNTGFRKGGSLGVFASILDVGALAQYRIKDTAQLTEKIWLGDILSPGVALSYGFGGNVPLSLNAGWQFGPGLTKIDKGNFTIESPSWRFLLSLTVDIPMFTIFNLDKSKTNRYKWKKK